MQKDKKQVSIGQKVRSINNIIDRYFHTAWEKAGVEPTRMQCATLHYLSSHQKEDVFQKDLEEALYFCTITEAMNGEGKSKGNVEIEYEGHKKNGHD